MLSLSDFLRRRKPNDDVHAMEAALHDRSRRVSARAENRRERIVFDAGTGGTFTVDIRGMKVKVSRGRSSGASATITSDAKTLLGVLDGSIPGVEAFLEGRLYMRGNVALGLELDDLLPPPIRDPRSPRCQRVEVDGFRSFYLEAGTPGSPPVVLLHGLGATSASFLPTIWDLARDHHVFALDLPGFGESGKPVRPLHAAYFARWLVKWLGVVGLERPHVVGNSMGGRVAIEIGLRAPESVDRLVLLAPSLAWRRYRHAVRLVRLLRPEIAVMPMRMIHRIALLSLRTMFARPERVADAAMNAAADEFVRVFATTRGRIAFFHAAREIYLEDPHGTRGFWDRLPALSRPSLFIFGDRDRLVPRTFLRHLRRSLPHLDYEVYADCGHVPQFEMPERTNASIRAFLAKAR